MRSSFLPLIGISVLSTSLAIPSSPHQILGCLQKYLQDESILRRQVDRLSKAVQVPTTITNSMTDPHDVAFAPFVDFQELLTELFPLVHSKAKVERVNRFGLIITLDPPAGTTSQKKPLLFTAHQDLNGLVGLLFAVEDLLDQDWTPSRTVVLAFGFVEEAYGKNRVEFILDEGGEGLFPLRPGDEEDNIIYALPDVSEKGAFNVVLSLSVPGGHSSIPPSHTGIGIMSEIISKLENTDLDIFEPTLGLDHPSHWLPSALNSNDRTATAEAIARSCGEKRRFTFQSSQAADIFYGGIKSQRRSTPWIIKPAIEKYNLTWSHFPDTNKDQAEAGIASGGHLTLSTMTPPLDPAPISPTDLDISLVWARFAGVTRSAFEFYWNLSRNIYRWSLAREGRALNIHTVDERIGMDAHLEAMMLYYGLIRAFDQ
ncbi:hypothetical protein BJX99DRAFT_250537 [Aspergillus californicus]